MGIFDASLSLKSKSSYSYKQPSYSSSYKQPSYSTSYKQPSYYTYYTTPSTYSYTKTSTSSYTKPSSYYNYGYYSGVTVRVSSNGLEWLWCLLVLLIFVPVCICKCRAKKQREAQEVEHYVEHHVETVEYTKVEDGDFKKAPDSEVPEIYNPNPMGQMNPAPMVD